MAEYEELRLQVTFVDQASVALAKINAQIKDLGSGANKAHFEDLASKARDITKHIKGMGEEAGGTADSAAGLTSRLAGLSRGVGAAGAAIAAQYLILKGYADKLQNFGQLARSTGISVAEVQEWSDGMERLGISTEQRAQTISGISQSMADIQRRDSKIIQQIFYDRPKMSPEQHRNLMATVQEGRELAAASKGAEFGNWIARTTQEIVDEGIKNGLTPQQAAEAGREWAEIFGTPVLAQVKGVDFAKVSQDQIARIEAQTKAAEKFNQQIATIVQNVWKVVQYLEVQVITFPLVTNVLTVVEEKTKLIADNIAQWQKNLVAAATGPTAEALGRGALSVLENIPLAQQQMLLWRLLMNTRVRRKGAGSGAPSKPLQFGAFGADDVAEERDRHLVEVSAELKRLNDYLLLVGASAGAMPDAFAQRLALAGVMPGAAGGSAGGGAQYGDRGGGGSGRGGGAGGESGASTDSSSGAGSGSGAGTGGDTSSSGSGTASDGGSQYYADQRAGFREELKNNPGTRELMGAITSVENPGAGPAVAESLMNRTAMVNANRAKRGLPPLTLRDMILGHPSIGKGKSFYGPVRNGAVNSHIRRMRNDPAFAERMNKLTDKALGGSDTIRGHTDQGSAGDPNYSAGGTGVNINGERFNDWGYPGARAWREKAQREKRESDERGRVHITVRPRTSSYEPDRGEVDRANSPRGQASGQLNVEVDAPRGTQVNAEGKGAFGGKGTSIERRMPLEAKAGVGADQ